MAGHDAEGGMQSPIRWTHASHGTHVGREEIKLGYFSVQIDLRSFINPTGILELSTSSPEYLAWNIRSMVHVLSSYQLSIACFAVSRPLH